MNREHGYLLAAIVLQVAAVAFVHWPWSPVPLVVALVLARAAGARRGEIARVLKSIAVVTAPVLVVRLIAAPGLGTATMWADYAAGLAAAALLAVAYLRFRGARGVQRALSGRRRSGRRTPVADMVRSALFLLPEVSRRLRDARDAARVRLSGGGRIPAVRRTLVHVRASFASLAVVPRRRAEAMVVRGIIGSPEGVSRDE